MPKILLVLHEPANVERIREGIARADADNAELALCRVLSSSEEGFPASLRTQQALTATLRSALGERAEEVAIFVVTGTPGDQIEDCARAWEATVVID